MNQFSVCKGSNDYTYTQPCSILDCSTQCVAWESFFGPIEFDSNGMNNKLEAALIQILPNKTTVNIVAPSNSPACNKDKHVCTEENGYSDCTCSYIAPSPWIWRPIEQGKYYTDTGMLVVLYLFSCILILITIGLYVFYFQNRRMFRLNHIPISTSLWFVVPLVSAINQITIVGSPNEFICSLEAWLHYIELGLFTHIPYYMNKETEIESLAVIKARYELILILLYYVVISCKLFIDRIPSLYSETVTGNSFIFYYYCKEYPTTELMAYCIWFCVLIQIYYIVFSSLKRILMLFILQLYYLYIII